MKEKTLIEKGKILTNISKIIAVLIAVIFNIVYLIQNGRIPSVAEQQSILLLCIFIPGIFLPIDMSLIFKNIFARK